VPPNILSRHYKAIPLISKVLKGYSFEIADLILIQDRSKAHGLRMLVRLDHGSDVEEYEEVLVFDSGPEAPCRWMMWRNAAAVFVRSTDGRSGRYRSAAQAFDAVVRTRRRRTDGH
jgi:hypothetical protein